MRKLGPESATRVKEDAPDSRARCKHARKHCIHPFQVSRGHAIDILKGEEARARIGDEGKKRTLQSAELDANMQETLHTSIPRCLEGRWIDTGKPNGFAALTVKSRWLDWANQPDQV